MRPPVGASTAVFLGEGGLPRWLTPSCCRAATTSGTPSPILLDMRSSNDPPHKPAKLWAIEAWWRSRFLCPLASPRSVPRRTFRRAAGACRPRSCRAWHGRGAGRHRTSRGSWPGRRRRLGLCPVDPRRRAAGTCRSGFDRALSHPSVGSPWCPCPVRRQGPRYLSIRDPISSWGIRG